MSNRLTVLAGQVAALEIEIAAHAVSAAEKAIAAGLALVEAKELVAHGAWGAWLAQAGIGDRKAQRYMQLARSGLKPDTVSDLGGIGAALAFLARWQAPGHGEALMIGDGSAVAFVMQDHQHAEHFHAVAVGADDSVTRTRRPMLWRVDVPGEQPVDCILAFIEAVGFSPVASWTVETVERRLADAIAAPLIEMEAPR